MSLKVVSGKLLRISEAALAMFCGCCGYYCCYEFEPDPDPEVPLPPTNCQNTPCGSPELVAGGPYSTLSQCSCQCCQKTICRERVYSTYTATLLSFDPLTNPCQPDPVNDTSAGLVAIDGGNLVACGGESPGQYCTTDWGSRCGGLPEDLEIGSTATLNQYYERYRAVDHCDDCIDTGGEFCTPGVQLLACLAWNDAPQWLRDILCTCAAAEDFCDVVPPP